MVLLTPQNNLSRDTGAIPRALALCHWVTLAMLCHRLASIRKSTSWRLITWSLYMPFVVQSNREGMPRSASLVVSSVKIDRPQLVCGTEPATAVITVWQDKRKLGQ